MSLIHRTKKPIVLLVIIFFIVTGSAPVSAGFFSSKTDDELALEQAPDPQVIQNPRNNAQVNALNEQAVKLFEQGHFEEAQALWEKAIGLLERTGGYVRDGAEVLNVTEANDADLLLLKDEEDLEISDIDRLYDKAVLFFQEQKYVASKSLFDRIETIIPDYKACRNYLTILDHKIKQAQQDLGGETFKKNATARYEERLEWERILRESRKELEKKLEEQAEPLYREAINFYKSRDFKLAKDYFKEVNKIRPNYKDTDRYLGRINADIQEEEMRVLAEKRKQEMLARKKEKEEWERILLESEKELQKKLIEQVEPIYQEAVHYYKNREFELAKNLFEDAEEILPGYKSTIKYLGRIDDDIEKEVRLRQEEKARALKQQKREEELARRREEKRLQALRQEAEQKRLAQLQAEVDARRKEREEWMKVLAQSEKEREQKLMEQAQFVYNEAIQSYQNRQFKQAKQDFLEVQKIIPNYKSTIKYLARIDQDIQEEEQQRIALQEAEFRRQVKQKKALEKQQWEQKQRLRSAEEEKRMQEFKAKALAREKQRAEWERIIAENEQARQKKLENEAEFVYQEALRWYEAERWEQARSNFLDVEKILPGYKETQKYLSDIDRDIELAAQERRRAKREKIAQQKRDEALARKREEEHQKELQRAVEENELARKEVQAESIYKYAMSLYKRENYVQAKEKLLEVETILPDYKSVQKYLKRVDRDIAKAQEQYQKEQRLAFERQIREQRLAQRREEDRLEKMRAAEEEKRLARLREEARIRERERREWEQTVKRISEEQEERLREQAESIYREAIRYYEAGWFEQAKETFEEVDVISPGYRSTGKYLARVENKIKEDYALRQHSQKQISKNDWREEDLARQKQEAQERLLRKREEKQRVALLQEKARIQEEKKKELKKTLTRIEEEHQEKMKDRAERFYRSARDYYKVKEFEKAKAAFISVEKVIPDYKSTEKYLRKIDKKIAKAKAERKPDELAGQRRNIKDPDFSVLEEDGNVFVNNAEKRRREMFSKEAEAKYREAIALYKAQEFVDAKLKFIEVESISSDYKSTLDYLSRIDKDIRAHQVSEEAYARDRNKLIQRALKKAEGLTPLPNEKVLSTVKDDSRSDFEQYIQLRREELKTQRRLVQKKYQEQFSELYDKAVRLYRDGFYEEARGLFFQIEEMKPGYKRAASYLKKTEKKIRKGLQKTNNNVVFQPQNKNTRNTVINEALNNLEKSL